MKPLSEMTCLELAAFIGAEFKRRNINVVLSGGSCVSIYSQEKYVSMEAAGGRIGTSRHLKAGSCVDALGPGVQMQRPSTYGEEYRHFLGMAGFSS